MTGKERYEARRQQEHDNEMARLRMQNAHYVREAKAKEVAELCVRAIEAFIKGEALLEISPINDGTVVRFVMQQEQTRTNDDERHEQN